MYYVIHCVRLHNKNFKFEWWIRGRSGNNWRSLKSPFLFYGISWRIRFPRKSLSTFVEISNLMYFVRHWNLYNPHPGEYCIFIWDAIGNVGIDESFDKLHWDGLSNIFLITNVIEVLHPGYKVYSWTILVEIIRGMQNLPSKMVSMKFFSVLEDFRWSSRGGFSQITCNSLFSLKYIHFT